MPFTRVAFATFLAACVPFAATAQVWRPELVAHDESGGRNIPNWRFDEHHTAGGHFQISDTNWRHYAPPLGIDLDLFPNAMSAPEQLQGQVAGKMWAELGYMPWVPYNDRLRRDLQSDRDHPVVAATAGTNASVSSPQSVPPAPHEWDVFPDDNPLDQSTPPQCTVTLNGESTQ